MQHWGTLCGTWQAVQAHLGHGARDDAPVAGVPAHTKRDKTGTDSWPIGSGGLLRPTNTRMPRCLGRPLAHSLQALINKTATPAAKSSAASICLIGSFPYFLPSVGSKALCGPTRHSRHSRKPRTLTPRPITKSADRGLVGHPQAPLSE